MAFFTSLLKKKRFWIFTIIIGAVAALAVYSQFRVVVPEFSSTAVERTTLVQSVDETGTVVADLELVYGWEIAGRVANIYKIVGDAVVQDDLIAELDNREQQNVLAQARAQLQSANALLQEQLVGPADEEIGSAQAKLDQARAQYDQAVADLAKAQVDTAASIDTAQADLDTAENNLQISQEGENSYLVQDAYDDLVNAVKEGLTAAQNGLTEADNILGEDNIFGNDEFEQYLGDLDSNTVAVAEQQYSVAKNAINAAKTPANDLTYTTDHTEIDAAAALMQTAILEVQTLLSTVQDVLAATPPIGDLSQSELEALRTSIGTDQTAVNTAATNVSNKIQAVTTARNTLDSYEITYDIEVRDLERAIEQGAAIVDNAEALVSLREAAVAQAQADLDALLTPPRDVDIAALRADVARFAAQVDERQIALDRTRLVALTDGAFSDITVDIGETVTANQEVMTLLSDALSIDLDISESDIAKVAVGDTVDITLDAFGEDVRFAGSVIAIDPAQTEISGVVYYTTSIQIELGEESEYDVRPGMTANVRVITETQDDALVIPRRAILRRDDNSQYVRIVLDAEKGVFEERTVTTGLSGDDGLIEVTSGLNEGDEIVTFLKED